jgi:hypothetical protein
MRLIGLAVLLVVLCAGAGAATSSSLPPLLGANFIRYEAMPPRCGGPSIVYNYDRPGVRGTVRRQLAAMRAGGMRAMRLIFYHASQAVYDLVPSTGGRLVEPYRSNLVNYLQDLRAAGFASVTVAFNPWAANDPIGYTEVAYDPSLFEENWQFIRDVRPLVKQYGPPTTRLDLIAEGAADFWQPRLLDYATEMWKRYVDEFGNADATISAITNPGTPGGSGSRLQTFIPALRATGRPLPTWFDVHPSWSAAALTDLRGVDTYLSSEGLTQPLIIAEQAYNNPETAAAVAAFRRESTRPVLEVMEWPLDLRYRQGPAGRWDRETFSRCPTPPYRIAAYAHALTGSQLFTLRAQVARGSASLTSAGVRVTALGAGTYSVVVHDATGRDGFRLSYFRLSGSGFSRRTGAKFRGTVKWRLRLADGDGVIYGRLRGPQTEVPILSGGLSP